MSRQYIEDWIIDHWDPSNRTMPSERHMNETKKALHTPIACVLKDFAQGPVACPRFSDILVEYHELMSQMALHSCSKLLNGSSMQEIPLAQFDMAILTVSDLMARSQLGF